MRVSTGVLRGSRAVFATKKPGYRPPAWILEKLAKLHPRIHLMYAPEYKQWFLMERCVDGKWEPRGLIEGRPTYTNTVRHVSEMRGVYADPEGWLRKIEERERALDAAEEQRYEDRMAEAHERMWHLHGSTERIALNGPRRNSS
jgi:hypothetical protein